MGEWILKILSAYEAGKRVRYV